MLSALLLASNHNGDFWWGGAVFVIFIAVILALVAFKLLWWRPWRGGWYDRAMDSEQVLKRRLASGEISEGDYQRLRDLLSK